MVVIGDRTGFKSQLPVITMTLGRLEEREPPDPSGERLPGVSHMVPNRICANILNEDTQKLLQQILWVGLLSFIPASSWCADPGKPSDIF